MFPQPSQNSLPETPKTNPESPLGSGPDTPAAQSETTAEIHASPETGLPSTLSEPAAQPIQPDEPIAVSSVDQEPATVGGAASANASIEPTNVETVGQPAAAAEFINPAAYQPTVQSTGGATQSPMAQKPSRKKLVLIIVAAVLIVLFGAATAVYALWYNNPQKVMADALQSAATAKTTVTNGVLTCTDDSSTDEFKAEVSFSSKVHTVDSHGQVEARLKLFSADATSEIRGAGMVSESGAVYLKFEDVKKLYTEFIEKQDLADVITQDPKLAASIQAFIKKIDGNWIKISQDDIRQLSGDYNYAKLKQCTQTAQNNFIQSADQQQELRKIYTDNQFIQLDQQATTTIDGELTNVYDVGFDVGPAYDAYAAYQDSAYAKALLACTKHVADATQTPDLKKPDDNAIREQQQALDKLTTQVYVTQFGHQLKRLTLAYADNEQKTSFNAVLNFGFNQAVNSPDPAQSLSLAELQNDLESLQEQLMSAMLEGSSADIAL